MLAQLDAERLERSEDTEPPTVRLEATKKKSVAEEAPDQGKKRLQADSPDGEAAAKARKASSTAAPRVNELRSQPRTVASTNKED